MAHEYPAIPAEQHNQILREQLLQDGRYLQTTGGHEKPKAVILAGQPGAGKGGLVRTALSEMGGNAVVIDPDELRSAHPDVHRLRGQKPYTWSGETHSDASRWAQELRADAVAQRKTLVPAAPRLPDRLPNERVSPDTAHHLLDERQTGQVE